MTAGIRRVTWPSDFCKKKRLRFLNSEPLSLYKFTLFVSGQRLISSACAATSGNIGITFIIAQSVIIFFVVIIVAP